jgi:small subunit ribosomal protein S6
MSNQMKYDVIYILDPGASAEDAAAVAAKIEQITADAKGTVLKKDDWGKRRLAYLVKKHREGHYLFFHLQIPAPTVAEITRNLRLMEKVIKFSIVRDEISHLKPKPKPVRNIIPRPEGSMSRPGAFRSSPAPAPAAAAPKAPEAPSAPAAAPPAN